jgi:hypothetical protein
MCLHTPADNCVTDYLQKLFDESKPYYVSDIVKILKDIPEYATSMSEVGVGPKVVTGSERRRAGPSSACTSATTTGKRPTSTTST